MKTVSISGQIRNIDHIITSDGLEIDHSNFPKGLYVVWVISENGALAVGKIIVEKFH